jgi:UDP-N-acetylmuramate--alanine ligase
VYFIGIGGIGMSAIARFFNERGVEVHGYDKTETKLTKILENEGMKIHYTDDVSYIPATTDLVVYTPAVPKDHSELLHFQQKGYEVLKRSQVLGLISRNFKTIAVGGTHGKTSTSSLVTHILRVGKTDCVAFLGGIAENYGTNYIAGKGKWVVVEADEYDRSFLQLYPTISIITSMDPDHLDIYGTEEEIVRTYNQFANQTNENGVVLTKAELPLEIEKRKEDKIFKKTYGVGTGSYCSDNVRIEDGFIYFDFKSPLGKLLNLKYTQPGLHNIENATAAIAVAQHVGIDEAQIREALETFKGVKRRFDIVYRSEKITYIDDYAHHPTELKAAIAAARMLFPTKRITGIFQPHLYSRTRDFQDGFAEALDGLDNILLMDIYPARELPIEGVTSDIIFDKMKNKNKKKVNKSNLIDELFSESQEIVLSLGAGDIDLFIEPIKQKLMDSYK